MNVQIFAGTTVLDFALPAGGLAVSPTRIESWVNPGETVTHALNLSNTGLVSISFQISETGPGSTWVAVTPLTGTLLTGEGQTAELLLTAAWWPQPAAIPQRCL